MDIRKSTKNDIPEILNIFNIARDYMVMHGNATQWGKGYPGEAKCYLKLWICEMWEYLCARWI